MRALYESQQQKDYQGAIWRCACGEDSYLVVGDFDDGELYLTITQKPTTLGTRLGSAWRAIRGFEFGVSNELLLDRTQQRALIGVLKRLGAHDALKDGSGGDTASVPKEETKAK